MINFISVHNYSMKILSTISLHYPHYHSVLILLFDVVMTSKIMHSYISVVKVTFRRVTRSSREIFLRLISIGIKNTYHFLS